MKIALISTLLFIAPLCTAVSYKHDSFKPHLIEGYEHEEDYNRDHEEKNNHNHDHNEYSHIEWKGIFDTPNSSYIWIAQKVDGSYADPVMKLAAIPVDSASDEMLEISEEDGKEAIEHSCVVLNHGETIVPSKNKCYLLTFDTMQWETSFPVDASSTSAIAFFAQHSPTEFEEDTHYLKLMVTGEDIEPTAEESSDHDNEKEQGKQWGKAIGASVLINIVTFSGLVFVVPCISAVLKKVDPTFVYAGFASFAAGAILSCAFFLLLFESTHLIADGWGDETAQIWRWGTMILLGLLLPVIVGTFVGQITKPASQMKNEQEADQEKGEQFSDDESGTEDGSSVESSPFAAKSFSEKARLVFAICFGDFLHNLCDGFFVAAAFSGCSDSMAWGVAIGTILHEIPQELSDFLILTGPQVGLSTFAALIINFVTGTSVILGAVIVLANEVSNATIGLLLAFGGGIYLQIGCVECMPKMVNHALSPIHKFICVVAFIIGTLLISLVLLDHQHCGGDGHDHGH